MHGLRGTDTRALHCVAWMEVSVGASWQAACVYVEHAADWHVITFRYLSATQKPERCRAAPSEVASIGRFPGKARTYLHHFVGRM